MTAGSSFIIDAHNEFLAGIPRSHFKVQETVINNCFTQKPPSAWCEVRSCGGEGDAQDIGMRQSMGASVQRRLGCIWMFEK